MNDLYTTSDAARVLGVSVCRVCQFCQGGRLGRRLGNRWIIYRDDLLRFKQIERKSGRPRRN